MRHITIVGAGQAGLQLALGLLQHNYQVTLLSNRTPAQLREGPILSTQGMFASAIALEREMGLDLWREQEVPIEGINVSIAAPDGSRALAWQGLLDSPAISVDQRLKFAEWQELFEARGGNLIFGDTIPADLDYYVRTTDLVIVAAGKGAINQLFPRNAAASPYDAPQRILALASVHGMTSTPNGEMASFNIIPDGGELFVIPALTLTGPCHYLFFEALPGGLLDCWQDVKTPEEHLALTLDLLATYLPWEAERCTNVMLTDANATLRGKFTPIVRHPIGILPSGASVLGMADAVVLNDPITGQGSNNAAKCAKVYLDAILEHGTAPFTTEWMQETFNRFWDYAQWVTGWTNAMLMPPPPHIMNILGAASQSPAIASRFVNGFDDPRTFFPWIANPAEADKMIAAEMIAV
jgi:hypothetical protein